MGPGDGINYEEGIGLVVEERGCGLVQNIGRFLLHSVTPAPVAARSKA